MNIEHSEFNKPYRVIYCSGSKSFENSCVFTNIDEAVDWIINTKIKADTRILVHRSRMSVRIMEAIRGKTTYQGLYWKLEETR